MGGNVSRRFRTVRRQRDILLICLMILLLLFTFYYVRQQTSVPDSFNAHPPSGYVPPIPIQKMHIVGGFSADSAEKIVNAAADGIQTIFYYGVPPTEDSVLGKELQAQNVQIIDGFISSNMHYYECQQLRTRLFPPYGLDDYCGQSIYPTFVSEADFLTTIATHLEISSKNQLVIGYWVLDDWSLADAGSANSLLIKIRQMIQHYTPGRSAICGFGSGLYPGPHSTIGWNDGTAANFSPQGCDAVGLYIYAAAQLDTSPLPPLDTYDWSMSKLLPTIFASLHRRGWNITKQPLIGIAQAFGGPRANTNITQVTPDSENIAAQSLSFCKHGAIGVTYYGWSDSGFGPLSDTPMTNYEIEAGIRSGVTACTHYWHTRK